MGRTGRSMIIGARIQELLTEKGISQRRLAADLFLHPNTVNGYIRNRRSPDFETANKIAEYLGTSLDDLLGNRNFHLHSDFMLNEKEDRLIQNYRLLDNHNQSVLEEMAANLSCHLKDDSG